MFPKKSAHVCQKIGDQRATTATTIRYTCSGHSTVPVFPGFASRLPGKTSVYVMRCIPVVRPEPGLSLSIEERNDAMMGQGMRSVLFSSGGEVVMMTFVCPSGRSLPVNDLREAEQRL